MTAAWFWAGPAVCVCDVPLSCLVGGACQCNWEHLASLPDIFLIPVCRSPRSLSFAGASRLCSQELFFLSFRPLSSSCWLSSLEQSSSGLTLLSSSWDWICCRLRSASSLPAEACFTINLWRPSSLFSLLGGSHSQNLTFTEFSLLSASYQLRLIVPSLLWASWLM